MKTERGRRLEEKQKLKFIYGIIEKELRCYVLEAKRAPGGPGEALLWRLELRLDNVTSGFCADSRARAADGQSGHVLVDGKRLSIPSARIAPGAAIALRGAAGENPHVLRAREEQNGVVLPHWLERTGEGAFVRALPSRADTKVPVELKTVIELYA